MHIFACVSQETQCLYRNVTQNSITDSCSVASDNVSYSESETQLTNLFSEPGMNNGQKQLRTKTAH